MRPTPALAEACFRRGLKHLYGKSPETQTGLDDLKQAVKLQPDDPRYVYHLGLAAHRQGDLKEAVRAYHQVLGCEGEFASRAAYPLALALLQSDEDPAAALVWSALPAAEQAMLSQAGVFRRRPYTLSPNAPLLWRGLAALDTLGAGDREQALVALDSTLQNSTHPVERRMAHYYLGALAARDEDWSETRRHWNAARAAGLTTPRLTDNLGKVYHRLAEERLVGKDAQGALEAATEALRHKPNDKRLARLVSHTHQRLAYEAASTGQWSVALEHWKVADAAEGGNFRLAYNLALAYERAKEFIAAGEKWREALRRRPRRDDHPDAIGDEQVAQLWRRAAEAYSKAGEYDEAVRVYRQAVKWNPANVETRLALAEALLTNGQVQAAENELSRILERDPDNVPVLLRQGEVIAAKGSWWRWDSPTNYWERVLELEPDNPTACHLLVDFYQDRADFELSWNNYAGAVEMYQHALEYQPQNGAILAALGGCYLRMRKKANAQYYIAQALDNDPANLNVYGEIIHAWLDVDKPDQAWEVMGKAEIAIDVIPYEFYIIQASYCIRRSSELARPWLERAIEKAPSGEPIFAMIGEMAASAHAWEIAQEYLERAIAADRGAGQAYLMLGFIAIQNDDYRAADKHWRKAESIARQKQDGELMERVQMTRFLFSGPSGLARMLMGLGGGPFGGSPFADLEVI